MDDVLMELVYSCGIGFSYLAHGAKPIKWQDPQLATVALPRQQTWNHDRVRPSSPRADDELCVCYPIFNFH